MRKTSIQAGPRVSASATPYTPPEAPGPVVGLDFSTAVISPGTLQITIAYGPPSTGGACESVRLTLSSSSIAGEDLGTVALVGTGAQTVVRTRPAPAVAENWTIKAQPIGTNGALDVASATTVVHSVNAYTVPAAVHMGACTFAAQYTDDSGNPLFDESGRPVFYFKGNVAFPSSAATVFCRLKVTWEGDSSSEILGDIDAVIGGNADYKYGPFFCPAADRNITAEFDAGNAAAPPVINTTGAPTQTITVLANPNSGGPGRERAPLVTGLTVGANYRYNNAGIREYQLWADWLNPTGDARYLGARGYYFPPSNAVSAITLAANAQVTQTAHGLMVGKILSFAGLTGAWAPLNGTFHKVVSIVDANNFTIDFASTGLGAVSGSPVYYTPVNVLENDSPLSAGQSGWFTAPPSETGFIAVVSYDTIGRENTYVSGTTPSQPVSIVPGYGTAGQEYAPVVVAPISATVVAGKSEVGAANFRIHVTFGEPLVLGVYRGIKIWAARVNTITAGTKASAAKLTMARHGLAVNDKIVPFNFVGTGWAGLNGNTYTVQSVVDADNFTINVNSSGFATFQSSPFPYYYSPIEEWRDCPQGQTDVFTALKPYDEVARTWLLLFLSYDSLGRVNTIASGVTPSTTVTVTPPSPGAGIGIKAHYLDTNYLSGDLHVDTSVPGSEKLLVKGVNEGSSTSTLAADGNGRLVLTNGIVTYVSGTFSTYVGAAGVVVKNTDTAGSGPFEVDLTQAGLTASSENNRADLTAGGLTLTSGVYSRLVIGADGQYGALAWFFDLSGNHVLVNLGADANGGAIVLTGKNWNASAYIDAVKLYTDSSGGRIVLQDGAGTDGVTISGTGISTVWPVSCSSVDAQTNDSYFKVVHCTGIAVGSAAPIGSDGSIRIRTVVSSSRPTIAAGEIVLWFQSGTGYRLLLRDSSGSVYEQTGLLQGA